MSKFELTKTIEARKLNPRTGIPTEEPPVTIPYGAIIENLTESRDTTKFSYLGGPFQASREALGNAIAPAQSRRSEPGDVETTRPEGRPAAAAEPMLRWEPVTSSEGHLVSRAQVPGGWLVTVSGSGLAFCPDPEHRWLDSCDGA